MNDLQKWNMSSYVKLQKLLATNQPANIHISFSNSRRSQFGPVAAGWQAVCPAKVDVGVWNSWVFPWTHKLPSGKLTWWPCQLSGLEDLFPLKLGDFRGQTVDLPDMASAWGFIWAYLVLVLNVLSQDYPVVNCNITMENHHFLAG